MTKEKALNILHKYEKFFSAVAPYDEKIEHCAAMLPKMLTFINQYRMHKFYRWLGFIQGCLFSAGYFTIDELREHTR